MDANAKTLIEAGDRLFSKRGNVMALWQQIADNFYPERADFTVTRSDGREFADNLSTSYPILARRELGDGLGSMLRPTEKEWFYVETTRQDRIDTDGKKWLERAGGTMRRAMYARASRFERATKEGDHDFAAFGQTVISVQMNKNYDDLLYRCWHLRDVAWCEDETGEIVEVHRKWKPYARDAVKMFPKCSQSLRDRAERAPYDEVELRHVVILAENYSGARPWKTKWVSLFIETDDATMLEETGSRGRVYVIPRWQTASQSQYAVSPATIIGLPDARLLQAMTLTLIEAGENYVRPPLIAVQDAIRSDIQLFSGGITMVDAEYDEKLGAVLRPLTQDKSGMPIGRDLRNDVREMLSRLFYLDKLTGPQIGDRPQMTAYEVAQRVQAYIRQALPLFGPMEQNYNGEICEETFDLLLNGGAFGSTRDMPRSLLGNDIRFRFENQLTETIGAQKGTKLANAKQLLAQVADVSPESAYVVDWAAGFRDALEGERTPMDWMRSPEEAQAMSDQIKQAQQQQQLLAGMQQAANVADTLGSAGHGLAKTAQAMPGAVGPVG